MNVQELGAFCQELLTLIGARLQEVILRKHDLGLGLYHSGQVHWLWLDLTPAAPFALVLERPLFKKSDTKPVLLFLKAHFTGKHLLGVRFEPGLGRSFWLQFTGAFEIQVDLFPHGANLKLSVEDKEMFFRKPKEIKSPPRVVANGSTSARELKELREQWRQHRGFGLKGASRSGDKPSRTTESPDLEKARSEKVKKLNKSIAKVSEELEKKQTLIWQEVGEKLKLSGKIEGLSATEMKCIEPSQSFSWNLQNCFAKAKLNKVKAERTAERLQELRMQLQALQAASPQELVVLTKGKVGGSAKGKSLMSSAKAKGRQIQIAGKTAVVGKSAKDNLLLLRKARAWDIWLHLKDFPGSHAVLQRNKNENISEADLHELAHWLVEQTFKEKSKNKEGEAFAVIYAECRFVRPIKGDRLGRVNYSNETQFTHKYNLR